MIQDRKCIWDEGNHCVAEIPTRPMIKCASQHGRILGAGIGENNPSHLSQAEHVDHFIAAE